MNNLNSGKHLILIDGSGFIFRAYHALPPLTKSDGTPTGAVSGYCNMLFKLINELKEFKPLILQSYLTIKTRHLGPIFIQITKQIDPLLPMTWYHSSS